jgi:P pilus assembly chaperone PapD
MAKSVKISSITKLAILFLLIASPTILAAQGNLLVTPRRVVFDGSSRVVDVNLANTGADTARYTISFIQYRMNEDGSFQEITEPDPGQNFADRYLRFFPRSVTLAPNEAQVIKIQVTNTNRLEPGEYRSHAYFRALPKVVALGEENQQTDTTQLSIQLTPIFGISIPIIVRVGTSNTTVAIEKAELKVDQDGNRFISFKFNREGNMSVYGDLIITHIAIDGTEKQIAAVNGIAVYTPGNVRNMNIPLPPDTKSDLGSGRLRITYSGQSQTRPQKYAEAEINL